MTIARLSILNADTPDTNHLIGPSEVVSLGRSPQNRVCLGARDKGAHDSLVSRFHAALMPTQDGHFQIQDLGSRNGVLINGSRRDWARLTHGDHITIGTHEVLFEVLPEAQTRAAESRPVAVTDPSPAFATKTRIAPVAMPDGARTQVLHGRPEALALLYAAMRAIAHGQSAGPACQIAVEGLVTILGCAEASVLSVNDTGEIALCIARHPATGRVSIPRAVSTEVIRTRRFLTIEDDNDAGVVRAIGVPIVEDERTTGILYLDMGLVARALSEPDHALLHFLATDIAAALHQERTIAARAHEKHRVSQHTAFEHMIVGNSPMVRGTVDDMRMYARTDVPLLITGDTGTGKELIASGLHYLSDRREHPLIELNCAAIPETILESELFGVAAGYPGFHSKDGLVGKITLAHQGTLFLDEIGDMSAALQAKILRFLDDQAVWPLGAASPQKVSVRVVAATNRDLRARIRDGQFREDLFQRLSVAQLHFPSLDERREDIPLLAGFFVARFREKYGSIARVSAAAVEVLSTHAWVGNVRELRNTIERAVIRAGAEGMREIEPRHLGLDAPPASNAVAMKLDEVQREHIARVLTRCDGNREKAYKLLGISRASLFSKIREYGL